jgi:YVTN family beta-propeller protein
MRILLPLPRLPMRRSLLSFLSALLLASPAAAAPIVEAVDVVHGRVYGYASDTTRLPGVIEVYDERTLALVTTIAAGTGFVRQVSPVDAARSRLFVADADSDTLTVVDTRDFSTQSIPIGPTDQATRLLLDGVSHRLWILHPTTDTILAVADDLSVQSAVFAAPSFASAVVDPRNDRLVMTQPASPLQTVAGADLSVATIPVDGSPSIGVDPTRDRLYLGFAENLFAGTPARFGIVDGDVLISEVELGGDYLVDPNLPDGASVAMADPIREEAWVANGTEGGRVWRYAVPAQTLTPLCSSYGGVPFLDLHADKYGCGSGSFGFEPDYFLRDLQNASSSVLLGRRVSSLDVLRSRVYASDDLLLSGTAHDAARITATQIAAGFGPGAVAVDPIANRIFVANRADDTVTVIDGATRATVFVDAGNDPAAIAVNPATGRAYVANRLGDSVTVIDGATLATSTIAVGDGPIAVAVDESANRIYVANQLAGTVTVIEGGDASTRTVNVGNAPSAIGVDPVATRAYVANTSSASVTVILGADLFTMTRPTGAGPVAVAVDATRKRAYLANAAGNTVTLVRADLTVQDVHVANVPVALATDAVTGQLWVANRDSDYVWRIDPDTLATTAVPVGDAPAALAVDPATHFVYVANRQSNELSRIDPVTLTAKTFAAGPSPLAIAVNPVTHTAYAANYLGTSVTELADFVAAPIPLTTGIAADPSDPTGSIALTLAPSNGFPALPVQSVFVQIDEQVGPWSPATLAGDTATFTTEPLPPGLHVARAWSSIGLEADPRMPLPGAIGALPFVVPAREGALSIDLTSSTSTVPAGTSFAFTLALENGRSTVQGFALFLVLVGPGGTPRYTLASGLPLTFPSSLELTPTIHLGIAPDFAPGTWTLGGAVVQGGVGIVDSALLPFTVE